MTTYLALIYPDISRRYPPDIAAQVQISSRWCADMREDLRPYMRRYIRSVFSLEARKPSVHGGYRNVDQKWSIYLQNIPRYVARSRPKYAPISPIIAPDILKYLADLRRYMPKILPK